MVFDDELSIAMPPPKSAFSLAITLTYDLLTFVYVDDLYLLYVTMDDNNS